MATVHSNSIEHFEPKARQLIEYHPQDDGTDDDNLTSSILSTASKLSAKFSSFTNSTIKAPEEIWTIRSVSTGEEELYARAKSVYWTRNSKIIKSFNFTDQVVKVFWSNFTQMDHVCIALSSGLSLFNLNGQHFQIPLPFPYHDMYATTLGIVIERNCDTLEESSSLPVLFALTHPTKEISPILFKPTPRTNSSYNTSMLTYLVSYSISIVSCHEKLPLCLMYNSQDCQHSIWKMRLTTDDEVDEFQRIKDESLTNTFGNNQSSCSFRESYSQASLSISSRHKSSLMQQTNHPSSSNTINFSPKMDLRTRPSTLGTLAASRLGVGASQMTPEGNSTNIRSINSVQNINYTSTPNRNRIINYLRDNIEDPILPELTCEQIWSEPSTNSLKGTKFFTTQDFNGDEFIVTVIPASTQLKMTKFESKEETDEFVFGKTTAIVAIDAMPIPSMNMMIVLDNSKSLALYSGLDRVTYLTLPHLSGQTFRMMPASTPGPNKGSIEMTPIQMSSARKRGSFGDRTSLGPDASIQQMFQALSPVPHANKHESKSSSPIWSGDIKRIEHVVGNSVFVRGLGSQQARFQVPQVSQTQLIERLINAMKRLISKEQGLVITTKWYQTRRSQAKQDLMLAEEELKLFKDWFLNFIGIEGDFFGPGEVDIIGSSDKAVCPSPSKRSRKVKDLELGVNTDTFSLFLAIHLLFEDLLLMKLRHNIACNLVELLLVLACLLKLDNYQSYYWLKFPQLQKKFGPIKKKLENLTKAELVRRPVFFPSNPPSVIEFLVKLMIGSKSYKEDDDLTLTPYPNLDGVTKESHALISLFCDMFNVDKSKAIFHIANGTSSYPKINVLSTRPYRSHEADQAVVASMVKLGKDRNYLSRLPAGYNLYLWDAILNCRESPPTIWNEDCFNLIGRMDLVSLVSGSKQSTKTGDRKDSTEDETLRLLFPDDIRVLEARRMLASDVPVEFSVTQRQGASEEESREETHRHLYLLNVRTMGMPIGRGAISLRTYTPVIGESFEVPRLELGGKVLSEDRPIEYTHDISVYPWPFFHNGVAAGLTICASSANNIIDSTWINYNRPRSNIAHDADVRDRALTTVNINNEHAGFLFALGLNGHLEKLSLMALHDYLCQNNDLTKLAILLGMSAAKRGSRDNNMIKVLSIHVDALLPPNSTELDVPAPVHAASIIGVGLLYQASGESHISKVLLEEIGRLPGPESNSHVDRESYSLSAGLAFGLVNLCKGGSTTISSSDQLRLYMLGGKRKPLTGAQRERYFKQDCHRGEEEYINTHITSPGGTLGLGLMYHRSGNQSVANWMRAPNTQTLLEYVRPDFLILRMLSYGLIMWDEVQPTKEWIKSLIPDIVSDHAFQRSSTPSATRLVDSSAITNSATDFELISQAYCNIVAGCCMAIAMRFAGTADQNAYKIIYKHTTMLIALSNKPALAEQAGRPCIEACLNVLVTSLAVVMAGTGDLGVMRVCRYLRSRLTQSCVFYGSYMAIHMALGILFLGACRYSLSTSPASIGALVSALYPIYPNHSSDNRYHLQALRHLYVLAAEPRLLIPRDITTNKPVYVNITILHRAEKNNIVELKARAPCHMPEVESIERVCIDDERYWRIEINDCKALIRCLLKDNGYLSVKRKAHSSNNQLVQDIESSILLDMPRSRVKIQKASALDKCLKEDRVEQYPAINDLLSKSQNRDLKYRSLVLEQIRLACSLIDNDITNKLNLLKPVVGEFNDSLSSEVIYRSWIKYLSNDTDWTNTDTRVAYYITLNDLSCTQATDADLVVALRELELYG